MGKITIFFRLPIAMQVKRAIDIYTMVQIHSKSWVARFKALQPIQAVWLNKFDKLRFATELIDFFFRSYLFSFLFEIQNDKLWKVAVFWHMCQSDNLYTWT